ncbi:acyl-CoA thioesterase [Flavobacterium silvaticum]|uniref:Acyl-CoA thioesterase n=1 Tax=Flavobacterium silvaticum TaxID=1852020 RepID=A0A972FLV6_9FLAO|nr:thioesterase family protein [Flavobacterium silvaticum]NMH28037.1 acyl-CoA thioesterase [Flavobacterium silvaticum]
MHTDTVDIRVRYSETDQMGVVYHGSYVPYFEIGRVEWLRRLGVSYKQMELDGVALPIVSMTINYKKPARYDELLTIRTTLAKQESVRIEFDCEIRDESGQLLTTAYFILVFVDVKTGKPVIPPAYIKELLSKIEVS